MEDQAGLRGLSVKCSIYDDLRTQVMSGALTAGERLREVEIAKVYNASRTPVRRALTALARDGLIHHERGRGWFVNPPSSSDLAQVALVRVILESQAVALATSHIDDAGIADLECILDRMDAALRREDSFAYGGLNERFHRLMYRLCRNVKLISLLEGLMNEYPNLAYPVVPRLSDQRQREHYRIMEAIVARHPDRARQLTYEHLSKHLAAVLGVDVIR